MLIGISGKIGSGKDSVGTIIQGLNISLDYDVIEYNVKNNLKFDITCGFEIKKYADKLKDIVCLLIGCTREDLEDRHFKNKELGEEWDRYINYSLLPSIITREEFLNLDNNKKTWWGKPIKITPRLLLQLIGTDCGRDIIHPNIWVNALFSGYKDNGKFINEEATSSNGGYYNKRIWQEDLPNWIITDVRFPNEAKAIKNRDGILIRINRPLIDKGVIDDRVAAMTLALVAEAKINKTGIFHPSETALDDYENWDYVINNDGTIMDLIFSVKKIMIELKLI